MTHPMAKGSQVNYQTDPNLALPRIPGAIREVSGLKFLTSLKPPQLLPLSIKTEIERDADSEHFLNVILSDSLSNCTQVFP